MCASPSVSARVYVCMLHGKTMMRKCDKHMPNCTDIGLFLIFTYHLCAVTVTMCCFKTAQMCAQIRTENHFWSTNFSVASKCIQLDTIDINSIFINVVTAIQN